jgi:hypothetical protein
MRRTILLAAVLAVSLVLPATAHAQRPTDQMGSRYTLVIDQLSGFRASAFGGNGFSYAGPLGIVHDSYTAQRFNNSGDDVVRSTTFWLAPSADIFLFTFPLSLGGLIEISSTSSSIDVQAAGSNATQTYDLPTTTNFTFLPRVGYLFSINEQFGIWPRAGLGYALRQTTPAAPNATRDSAGGVVTDIDVGFLWRPVQAVFFRLGPEAAFTLGASHSSTNAGVSTSASASFFQLGLLGGVGVMISL